MNPEFESWLEHQEYVTYISGFTILGWAVKDKKYYRTIWKWREIKEVTIVGNYEPRF
jgi:hypothetical protein